MFEKGARINLVTIGTAINRQRVDVLKLLFTDSKLSDQVDGAIKEPQKLLEDARKKDNEEVIALIKGYIERREGRAGKQVNQPNKDEEEKLEVAEKETSTEIPWWQFWGTRNESRMEDCNASDAGSIVHLLRGKHQK